MDIFTDSERYVAKITYEGRSPGNYGGSAKGLSDALEKELGFLLTSRWSELTSIAIDIGLKE
jgi:hypothetical protein